MTVFIRLLLAHLLTEFVIFREQIPNVRQKNKFLGYFLHALIFVLCILALCLPYMGMVWLNFKGFALNGWQMLPLLAAAHIAADIACKTGGRYNTVSFILWQLVAVMVLFLAFPLLDARQAAGVNEPWENFLIIITGALFAAYFLMTLIYFIEKDLAGEGKPEFDVNYANMLIRVVLYFLLLVPGYWGWLLGAAWTVFVLINPAARGFDISPARIYVGLPLTAATAVIIRIFL